MQAIILAGGKGRRLLPYTTVIPKPLMPIGDYPIIEIVLRQLKHYGFTNVTICTGYLHELIRAYISSRPPDGLNISYTHEEEPLGTIGPLHLIKNLEPDFIVMNGDILTDINLAGLMKDHTGHVVTIASYARDVNIDFGVMSIYDSRITDFREKPTIHFNVSMGIYVFSRKILEYVPTGKPFGFDELMHLLIQDKIPIHNHPFSGYWRDIGRPEDYVQSLDDFERDKKKFLP